jgi:hypothetical protein
MTNQRPVCSVDVSYNGKMHTVDVSRDDVHAAPRMFVPYGTNVKSEQVLTLLNLIASKSLGSIFQKLNLLKKADRYNV